MLLAAERPAVRDFPQRAGGGGYGRWVEWNGGWPGRLVRSRLDDEMRRLAVTLAALVLAGAAVAPAAQARIVPQRGMMGVRLGMTAAQVRARLGAPDSVSYPSHPILRSFKLYRYGLTKIAIHRGRRGTVFSFFTTSRRERTAKGVGVGSREATVRRHVRGVRCRTEFGLRHCWVGSFRPGRRVTDFAISRTGRVRAISLGFVID